MPHRAITNPDELAQLFTFLEGMKLPITVSWVKGIVRSLDQNHLQFKWATEAAAQYGDRTPVEQQREWKLRHGVPILRKEDAEFRAFYDRSLISLTYEEKLAAMDFVPVSSRMTVKQMSGYLDTIQRECLEQGLRLTNPDEAKQAA